MAQPTILSPSEVRLFISDYPEDNHLLDAEEFSDPFIILCTSLAVDEFNAISPKTTFNSANFPSKSLLMTGTLWQIYAGSMAKMARNHLSYSDGGIQIPIEEKYEMYKNLADTYGAQFQTTGLRLKTSLNMEDGWGQVSSDEALFPIW
jgi:hypothetical protein